MKTENGRLVFWSRLCLGKTCLVFLCLLPQVSHAIDDLAITNESSSLVDFIAQQRGTKILIPPGEYLDETAVIIPPGIDVYGGGKEKTIIHAGITLSQGSSISDLTISDAGLRVIPDADVSIKNVTITHSPMNAVETFGIGTLYLESVSIQDAGEKGISVQHGGYLTMLESEIVRSQEEGLDVRENASVYIEKSRFTDNKESGIEVVVGGSMLTLVDSSVANNHASGISAQYYSLFPAQGWVYINSSKITDNKKSGVSCDTPSGGSAEAEFWKGAILIQSDSILENNSEAVNKRCKFEPKQSHPDAVSLQTEHATRKKSADEKKSIRSIIERETENSLPSLEADLQKAQDASKEILKLKDSHRVRLFGLSTKEKALYKELEGKRHAVRDGTYVTWKKTTNERSIQRAIKIYNEIGFVQHDQKVFWDNYEEGVFDKWLDRVYELFGQEK